MVCFENLPKAEKLFMCLKLKNFSCACKWIVNMRFGRYEFRKKRLWARDYWVIEMIKFLTSIWRTLFSIGFDFHSSSDSAVSFSSREICHVDECIVESRHQVNNSEVVFVLSGTGLRWSKVIYFFFLYFHFFLRWLYKIDFFSIKKECRLLTILRFWFLFNNIKIMECEISFGELNI